MVFDGHLVVRRQRVLVYVVQQRAVFVRHGDLQSSAICLDSAGPQTGHRG